MSFILNALRKSEQERQALQPETVADRILLPQPQQGRSKTTKLLVFLITLNVLVIAYIVWSVRNNLITTPPSTTAPTISKPLSEQETKRELKTHPERLPQKTESETASIAELIEGEKQEPAPLPAKPVITKKPEADTIKQPAIVNKPALPIPTIPVPAAVKVQPTPLEAVPEQKDIPFLNDLSFDFRQTVPKLNINVFVYSQQPEERFVMVDMVKYKQGQQMKDAMLLKEFRPDSLVINYKNQTFKIKRP